MSQACTGQLLARGEERSLTSGSIYELQGVTKSYGSVDALADLTVSLEGGDPIAIVGYSGAGKTTLLKTLAGLETPTKGTIRFKGKEVTERNINGLRRVATMLFQEPVSFNRSVLDNVTYGLEVRGVQKEEAVKRASDTLSLLRLKGFEKRRATKLSGGEQQRVSLARALVLDPEVLLLDEPTSNLDPANATAIMEAILEYSKKGLIIISTHNFPHVRKLTKRAIYLEKGRIVETGPTESLLSRPKQESTKRFVNGLF
jgi:ABC-type methionine transport system ATPase subunit